MPFTLPNPTSPTNGQSLDATPILANEVALANAIASFDGSQIQTGTIASTAFATTANPNTLLAATTFPFVQSGVVWSTVSGLAGTMSGGTIYYNGTPVTVNSVASHTFTASKDTYIDVDNNGNVTYQAVTNNAASASLTANSVRVAIVITGSSAITFINLGQVDSTLSGFAPIISSVSLTVTDSLGNLIYPTDPQSKILGYRENTSGFTLTSSQTTPTQVTGLSVPVIVPTGRKIEIDIFARDIFNATAANSTQFTIWDGVVNSGTQIGNGFVPAVNTAAAALGKAEAVVIPSANSKTYNAGLVSGGSTNVTLEAASSGRAFIRVRLA